MADPEQGAGAQMEATLARWQTLKKQAEGGELKLDDAIGWALATHAEAMRGKLETLTAAAATLEDLQGFGELNSAKQLRDKFAKKANNSDDSAVKRLQQSIDVVTLMKDTYEIAIGKLTMTDQEWRDKLAALAAGV